MSELTCFVCGATISSRVMASVSHTIKRGELLCTPCGQKETCDPLWADGTRIGFERHQAAIDSIPEAAEAARKEGE